MSFQFYNCVIPMLHDWEQQCLRHFIEESQKLNEFYQLTKLKKDDQHKFLRDHGVSSWIKNMVDKTDSDSDDLPELAKKYPLSLYTDQDFRREYHALVGHSKSCQLKKIQAKLR